ncbi:class I SAM-dependent methyltransferase [Lutibacter sp. TH_r2]|uniref:class I SAM-dependent methyltransferase n=1 Tax=Lutibacter sp. TH_r2 TaxID=3082083 RepID=UPI0029557127|nr:class I SAM-dependent methyltransferase [Lutibacter sp. TH_r2]MDV7188297.1 class I SAM-dependent methyltransferase [Lutibacter sp. TH_r2]
MNLQVLQEVIKGTDIYILDQILKLRYQPTEKILDAGCGSGRNLTWFYKAGFQIHGIDINTNNIEDCKQKYPEQKEHFTQAPIEVIPYKSDSFDHVICNAVLHFAKDLSLFTAMLKELIRVLKPNGSLFIRTASNFGMENQVNAIGNGNYKLPDGSTRFLLTEELLETIEPNYNVTFIEVVKTTIVKDKRCMTTLVLKKK